MSRNFVVFFKLLMPLSVMACLYFGTTAYGNEPKAPADVKAVVDASGVAEEDLSGSTTMLSRAWQGGIVVFAVLLVLIGLSVVSWAIVVSKWLHLKKIEDACDKFVKSFWESRSLNELNGRLTEYPYSPAREMFRSGYSELVRGSQMREQVSSTEVAIRAGMDNLGRSLRKAKHLEKKRMERFLSVLAITASAAPFIGLFGTVWGIMNAFEGIARTGSASLAAVAPGISEALIATAFGLAAAIPAVIGYNIFAGKIRSLAVNLDGFSADFLNIVERYLAVDRPKSGSSHSPQNPL